MSANHAIYNCHTEVHYNRCLLPVPLVAARKRPAIELDSGTGQVRQIRLLLVCSWLSHASPNLLITMWLLAVQSR